MGVRRFVGRANGRLRGEGRAVAEVAGVRLEEDLGPGPVTRQGPRSGSTNPAHKVGSVKGGRRAQDSGVGDRRKKCEVFEGKEGIGRVRKGLADARETSGGEEDVK
jgi:hypothetical protein